MSLNSEKSRVQYFGNGSASLSYPVTFVFYDDSDLKVVVTDAEGSDTQLIKGCGYSVAGAGDENGGSIVTSAAYDARYKITIYREVEATQKTVYEENADFPAESHERALDKLTMLVQQLGRKFRSTFRTRESDGDTVELAAEPSSLMGFDAAKTPRTMSASEVAAWLNVSQQFFGQGSVTFLNAADRNAAAPQFLGQIGVQLDTLAIYTAYSMAVGAWGAPISGIANGAISTAMLAEDVLSADAVGRARMAGGYISLPKVGDGIFTADVSGRKPFAAGFVDTSLCAADLWRALAPVGAVINSAQASSSEVHLITGSGSAIPTNVIPTYGLGKQIVQVTITPSSVSSKIRMRFSAFGSNSMSNDGYGCSVVGFRDSVNVGASIFVSYGSYRPFNLGTEFVDSPGTVSPVVYSIWVGNQTASNVVYVNAGPGAQVFGGAATATLVVEEIKG